MGSPANRHRFRHRQNARSWEDVQAVSMILKYAVLQTRSLNTVRQDEVSDCVQERGYRMLQDALGHRHLDRCQRALGVLLDSFEIRYLQTLIKFARRT